MDLQKVKLFLRIDNDEEDDFLQGLLRASELYLENAGCKKNYDNELYSLAVKLLVSHWYENREAVATNGEVGERIALGVRSLCLQYKIARWC